MKKVICRCIVGIMFISTTVLMAEPSPSPKNVVAKFIEAFKNKDTKSYISFLFLPAPNSLDKMTPEMESQIYKQLSTALAPWLNAKILSTKETDDYALVAAYEILKDNKKSHYLSPMYLVKTDGKWKISPAFIYPIPKPNHGEKEFTEQIEILKKWYNEQLENHTAALCPKIEVTKKDIPYTKDVTLSPGCALNIVLPNKKNLAIWCMKTGPFSLPGDSDLRLSYGEKPFIQPEQTWIELPGGGRTTGPLKSYIRRGAVGTWSSGPGHEYTIFIDDIYRVTLREDGDKKGKLPVKISVNMATKEESVRPEDVVKYLVKELKSKNPQKRINTIKKLQDELILGSTYAVPKRQFIIDSIKPLDKDADPKVQEQANETLRVLGDVDSIMKVISPEPKGKFLDLDEALGLGQDALRCKKASDKEKIFKHVKTFLNSEKPELRCFAIAFFAYSEQDDEVKTAIKKAMKDPSPKVREATVFALDKMDDGKGGMGERVKMLEDSNPKVVIAALEHSIGYGEENEFPIAKIKPLLKSDNRKIKLAAIYALSYKDNKEAAELLLPFTYDKDDKIRAEAVSTLSGEKVDTVYKRMFELLNDKHPMVRIRALQCFDLDDYTDAIPYIEKLIKNEKDKDVLRVANTTRNRLKRLRDKGNK